MLSLAKLIDMLRQSAKLKAIENGILTICATLDNAYSKFYRDNSGTHIPWIKIHVRIEAKKSAEQQVEYSYGCDPSAYSIQRSFQSYISLVVRHICRNHKEFTKE